MSLLSKFSTERFRWWALVVLSLGLAIVVIDNTVLNVAIPYVLRDLNTDLESIQWVISGYALIIATILIFMGRLGDIVGRKKVFIFGTALFAVGSFFASISHSAGTLFIGEAIVEAIGAAAMLTSSLSLLASEFQGKERAIAFGVWGAVAGASASIGPLLGGYFTTYHSWRWSLRINVLVAIITILGSVFIKEAKSEKETKGFDWTGIVLSGLGMFSTVFGFIEGQKYGWWKSDALLKIGNWQWPWENFSVIPVAFALAIIFLTAFVIWEIRLEKKGGTPVLKMSLFKNAGFTLSLTTLTIVSLGQFGIFFILPLYFQNVLGLTALKTGLAFLYASVGFMAMGALSGFIASKVGAKWVVAIGMVISTAAVFWLIVSMQADVSYHHVGPALILFGLGGGMATAQLTNLVLSAVSIIYAGEVSAISATMRQVGTSIGIAIMGTVLATSLSVNIKDNIRNERLLDNGAKDALIQSLNTDAIEGGSETGKAKGDDLLVSLAMKSAVQKGFTDAAKRSVWFAAFFLVAGTISSISIPYNKEHHQETPTMPVPPKRPVPPVPPHLAGQQQQA